jgi:hypothetical protein
MNPKQPRSFSVWPAPIRQGQHWAIPRDLRGRSERAEIKLFGILIDI